MICRLRLIFFTFLVYGVIASADAAQGWVLGSFSERGRAMSEATRLHSELQQEIIIVEIESGGRTLQRLIVPVVSGLDVKEFKRRLSNLGIGSAWLVNLPGEGGMPAPEFEDNEVSLSHISKLSFYIVVGSFNDVSEAVNFEGNLDRHFARVSSESVLAQGKVFHRVKVGPYADGDLDLVRQQLYEMGISGTWKQVAEVSTQQEPAYQVSPATTQFAADARRSGRREIPAQEEIEIPVRDAPSKVQAMEQDGTSSGFNLAVLRRASAVFASPENSQKSNGRWKSEFSGEYRGYHKDGYSGQDKHHIASSFQAEYFRSANDGDDVFTFVPFVRWDDNDSNRSHFDIRELSWVHVADGWELRTGIRKVFWGVTESQHLVDIINQTDLIENPDGEEKLGQPMINLSLTRDWGIVDIYVLPGFREREFQGDEGRPRIPFLVNEDMAIFASGAKNARTDVAVRWSQQFAELELGVSHFVGTSREPLFEFRPVLDASGAFVDGNLIPIYDVIDQTGLDAKYLMGDWTWKLETISRSGQGDRFTAATFGFEKSFVGLFGTSAELGIVTEYLFDDRDGSVPFVVGDDDVALGFRLTANDVSEASALLMWIWDRDSDEMLTMLEARAQIGSHWKLVVEASIFSHGERPPQSAPGFLYVLMDPASELGFFQDEDFVKLELTRSF
ncbi:MAG: hypothetical protein ACJAVI_003002 [Candidatus Azotimanducaceae bacterium]|jgi:hypothetical protein